MGLEIGEGNLESLQDGIIDFIKSVLEERDELLKENQKLKESIKSSKEYFEQMIGMKEEKIDLLKLKAEVVENRNENLKEKLNFKENQIGTLKNKLKKVVEILLQGGLSIGSMSNRLLQSQSYKIQPVNFTEKLSSEGSTMFNRNNSNLGKHPK